MLWVAPADWSQQLLDIVGPTAETNNNHVETTMRGPAMFEIVVETNRGVAQFITLQHELHSLIESWCESKDPLGESQTEQLIQDEAEARFREILAESFGDPGGVQVENAELEQGSEWLFKFSAGTDHWVGTARKDHRSLLLHVAHPLAP